MIKQRFYRPSRNHNSLICFDGRSPPPACTAFCHAGQRLRAWHFTAQATACVHGISPRKPPPACTAFPHTGHRLRAWHFTTQATACVHGILPLKPPPACTAFCHAGHRLRARHFITVAAATHIFKTDQPEMKFCRAAPHKYYVQTLLMFTYFSSLELTTSLLKGPKALARPEASKCLTFPCF